jgi:hypothetical protein
MDLLNRYKDNDVIINSNKKRVYKTILYPKIENSISDIYILVNNEDRLDLLAHKYYGDVRYWWILAQANNLGKGSLRIPGGSRLRIPKNLSTILDDFNFINANR